MSQKEDDLTRDNSPCFSWKTKWWKAQRFVKFVKVL